MTSSLSHKLLHRFVFALAALTLSTPVFADYSRIGTASKSISVSNKSSGANTVLNFELPVYSVVHSTVVVPATCSKVECPDIQTDGTKGDWKGFYTAPKIERPKRLADAIKGIGIQTADRILAAGYFTKKPHSWGAFSAEIIAAQATLRAEHYSFNFAEAVLNQYGAENARNLGYYTEGACKVVTYDCSIIQDQFQEVQTGTLVRQVELQVRGNVVLQNFERDTIDITVGDKLEEIGYRVSSPYNNYRFNTLLGGTVQSPKIILQAIATGRNHVEFPDAAVQSVALANSGNGMSLILNVNPQYFPTNESGSEIKALVTVCRASWVGSCYKKVTVMNVNVDAPTSTISIPASGLDHGHKYFASVKLQRINSKLYTNNYTSSTDSRSLKY